MYTINTKNNEIEKLIKNLVFQQELIKKNMTKLKELIAGNKNETSRIDIEMKMAEDSLSKLQATLSEVQFQYIQVEYQINTLKTKLQEIIKILTMTPLENVVDRKILVVDILLLHILQLTTSG